MPKITSKSDQKLRHDPLHLELAHENGLLKAKAKSKSGRTKKPDSNDKPEAFVDAGLSRKILQIAKEQQEEVEQEEGPSKRNNFHFDDEEITGRFGNDDDESDDDDYEDYEEIEEVDVDPEEDALFNKYIGNGPVDGEENEDGTVVFNLADRIMEKIREKEMSEGGSRANNEIAEPEGVMLPPKVIEVYTRVGELLSRYRSGKLPKAFKIIPSLRNWQDILYVTNPGSWSTQAVYEATKLFVSNLKANQSQKFITNILLERFRDDIQDNKTLNYHVYRALKKALYKPAAFFKGFLFPLCESGTCSLREAVIAGSILSKVSVPALHSAAALLRLADMEYSGPNSLFIKILLDKKYALPYKVIDGVVYHFIQFRAVESQLPVVWHQSLLVFAQRYKNDITEDQRDALLSVVKVHSHPSISPEIRRELLTGATRVLSTGMDLS